MIICIVLSAIDFDDDAMFETGEVDDGAALRYLAPKMIAAIAPRPEVNPELHLLGGHRLAEAARDRVGHGSGPKRLVLSILTEMEYVASGGEHAAERGDQPTHRGGGGGGRKGG